MGIYNEILSGRFNRFAQRLFAIKAKPPLRQLAGELMTTYEFLSGVEDRQPQGWNRYGAVIAVVGAAGNSATIRITNDIGTKVIAVLEKISVWVTLATVAPVNFTNYQPLVSGHVPNLSSPAGGNAIDFRTAPNANQFGSVIQISSSQNTNGAGSALAQLNLSANIPQDLILFEDHELTMGPQSLWQVSSNTAANTLNLSVIWRERALEESELF